jgi:hypothetical protein
VTEQGGVRRAGKDGAMSLVLVGYWKSDDHPEWPQVDTFVDFDWDEDERIETWSYFSWGTRVHAYLGYSLCRLCGEKNGSAELTDGTYVWPEGLAHYIRQHGVRLPPVLVDHARRRRDLLEAEEVDHEWWRRQG